MPWLILAVSAVLEAVWATALGMSDGLSNVVPSIVFFVALTFSMLGLGWAMKSIPIGTAYAVWTGGGAALTVLYAVIMGAEMLTPWKALFLCGIIAAVIGLKLAPEPAATDEAAEAAQ